MSTYVYTPYNYEIGVGIPGTPAFAKIEDWVNITTEKQGNRFNYSRGIFGEPFVEMSSDSSRVFNLTILQTSSNIETLHNLFMLQLTGIVGFPFSINDTTNKKNDSITEQNRRYSLYPVSWIVDEPTEEMSLQGEAWVYKIAVSAGATIYR